jgi:hypothetical protein
MSQGALELRTPVKLAVDTLERGPRCQRVDGEHERVVKRIVGDVHFWSADFLAEKTSQSCPNLKKTYRSPSGLAGRTPTRLFGTFGMSRKSNDQQNLFAFSRVCMRIHAFGDKAAKLLWVPNSITIKIICSVHAFDGFEFVFLQELVALFQRPVVRAQKRHRLNSRHAGFFSFFSLIQEFKKKLIKTLKNAQKIKS